MSGIAGSIFMLSTVVISLMYCSIQTRKRGLTADRENNMWRYLDGASAPPAKKKKVKLAKNKQNMKRRNGAVPSYLRGRKTGPGWNLCLHRYQRLPHRKLLRLIHNDTVLIVEVFEVLSLDENPNRSEVHDYNCLFVLNGVRMFLCC